MRIVELSQYLYIEQVHFLDEKNVSIAKLQVFSTNGNNSTFK